VTTDRFVVRYRDEERVEAFAVHTRAEAACWQAFLMTRWGLDAWIDEQPPEGRDVSVRRQERGPG
jgi:hypothetical protein